MIEAPECVTELLDIFDGAAIVAIEHVHMADWPTEILLAQENELWVSKDLSAYYSPRSDNGLAHTFTSIDEINGREKIRVYRQLDRQWFIWLYSSIINAKPHLDTDTWKHMTQRFNELWTIAIAWQGWQEIAKIKSNPRAYLDANYQAPQPHQPTVDRYNARRDGNI